MRRFQLLRPLFMAGFLFVGAAAAWAQEPAVGSGAGSGPASGSGASRGGMSPATVAPNSGTVGSGSSGPTSGRVASSNPAPMSPSAPAVPQPEGNGNAGVGPVLPGDAAAGGTAR